MERKYYLKLLARGVNIILWRDGYDNVGVVKYYEYGKYIDSRKINEKYDLKTQSIIDKFKYPKNKIIFLNKNKNIVARKNNGLDMKKISKEYQQYILENDTGNAIKVFGRLAPNKFGFYFLNRDISHKIKIKIFDDKYKFPMLFTGPQVHHIKT
ncbi:MAG: hypothetical protein LBB45_06540 [Methanobrevibacter sp.]|nr:hypothetical protein [Candidatus Methanovirga basalitermitum]